MNQQDQNQDLMKWSKQTFRGAQAPNSSFGDQRESLISNVFNSTGTLLQKGPVSSNLVYNSFDPLTTEKNYLNTHGAGQYIDIFKMGTEDENPRISNYNPSPLSRIDFDMKKHPRQNLGGQELTQKQQNTTTSNHERERFEVKKFTKSGLKLRGSGVGGSFKALNINQSEFADQRNMGSNFADSDTDQFDDNSSATTVQKDFRPKNSMPLVQTTTIKHTKKNEDINIQNDRREKKKLMLEIGEGSGTITVAKIIEDTELVAVGFTSGDLVLFDIVDFGCVAGFKEHQSPISCLQTGQINMLTSAGLKSTVILLSGSSEQDSSIVV